MYGMVNKAIEDMVRNGHGEDTWDRIRDAAGLDIDVFISNDSYPDDLTYRLVDAASRVLGAPADEILKAFGEHWVLHTAQDGYGSLMAAGGGSLPEFLLNLPNFHTRVQMIFPNLQPPTFECGELTERSLLLHYRTHRPGLANFVIGLLQGLGKRFGTPVRVTRLDRREDGASHDTFRVEWTPPGG